MRNLQDQNSDSKISTCLSIYLDWYFLKNFSKIMKMVTSCDCHWQHWHDIAMMLKDGPSLMVTKMDRHQHLKIVTNVFIAYIRHQHQKCRKGGLVGLKFRMKYDFLIMQFLTILIFTLTRWVSKCKNRKFKNMNFIRSCIIARCRDRKNSWRAELRKMKINWIYFYIKQSAKMQKEEDFEPPLFVTEICSGSFKNMLRIIA